MKTCSRCKETKEMIQFRIINYDKMKYRNICRDCEKINSREYMRKRNPLKRDPNVSEELLERRKKYVKYKEKYREMRPPWHQELYEYIEKKNIFSKEDLKDILEWLKKVDILGGRTV